MGKIGKQNMSEDLSFTTFDSNVSPRNPGNDAVGLWTLFWIDALKVADKGASASTWAKGAISIGWDHSGRQQSPLSPLL